MNLIQRVDAAQNTVDLWLDREFKWGSADCGQLVGAHLEAMGVSTPLADAGNYKTEIGALRSMTKLGAKSMEDFLDKLGFERIPPTEALPGDIVGFPGGSERREWTALGISVGSDRVIGFAGVEGEAPLVRVGPTSICTVAWRVG